VPDGELILVAAALLAAGLLASLLAGRLRVPGLVLFLGVGMLIGTDGTGWIDFNDYELARTVGVIALGLILFEGGLTAGFGEIRPVLGSAVSLALLGTLTTALVGGLAAAYLFDLSVLEGLLLGSILASTDGAAIFAVLRGSTLRRKLARTLEGEAGLNDPVAVLLVLGFVAWLERPDYGPVDMVGLFVVQLGIGLAVGLLVGWLAVQGLSRARLASAGLYPVASIATAGLAYGGADSFGGSGFLAVYLAGLVLGSAPLAAQRTMVTFHDGLGWIAQVVMFLTLGLLILPSQLPAVAIEGTVFAFLIAVVARPLGVLLATALSSFGWREQVVLGWAGLRGAVPVVLATFPVIAGTPRSLEFFNVVFFAVVLSTLLQGSTFEPLARALGVTTNEAALPTRLVETSTVRRLGAEVVEYEVAEDDAIVGHRVRELGLPREALLNVIVRGDQAIPPRGSTTIEAGDGVHVLVRQEVAIEFRGLLERWRTGPVGPPPRPPRIPRAVRAPATVRPWREEDGDPARPTALAGAQVVEQLRTRRDGVPGALVALDDGRYGVTGPVLSVGSRGDVQRTARERLGRSTSDAEQAWWREVIGALAR
jgi:cell volume regulation protein A